MKETTRVDVDVGDALAIVERDVPRLRIVRSGDGAELHAPSGLWVATIRPRDYGADLIYRSGPTTPTLRNAVLLATAVRDVLPARDR